MSDNLDTRRGGGSFKQRLVKAEEIQIQDLQNPWNFYFLFLSDERTVNSWCQANGLLATSVKCSSKVKIGQNEDGLDIFQDCTGEMFIKERAGKAGGASFRCNKNLDHEKSLKLHSL